MPHFRFSPERIILLALLSMSLLALAFMGQLVEAPKVLMGRSLSAIEPSLFPRIMIAALAVLSALVLLLTFKGTEGSEVISTDDAIPTDWKAVQRGALLFACMLFFALTMETFGFLISTAITMVMISVLTGNRSVLQIGILAIVGPILLYLTATRVLAVSLPELNVIELLYARILGL